jgi:hypothetical protein
MKLTFWYLAIGLEVWLGVSGILMGVYSLMPVVGIGATPILSEFQEFAGSAVAVVGALLVADAVRRVLKVRVLKEMERFGNPLDSPTQAG